MKMRLSPIEIALKDLPAEGREFSYTRESGELNDALADLIGNNDYQVEFRISPMGNAFDLRGKVKAQLDLECSLCAVELKYPVTQAIHELLVVEAPLAKGDQLTKANHAHEWAEGGPDYMVLASNAFYVPDYIHEVIALAEPIRPLGKPDCDLNCENLSDSVKKWLVDAKTTEQQPIKANPFQMLEKIKLKS